MLFYLFISFHIQTLLYGIPYFTHKRCCTLFHTLHTHRCTVDLLIDSVQLATHARFWLWLRRPFVSKVRLKLPLVSMNDCVFCSSLIKIDYFFIFTFLLSVVCHCRCYVICCFIHCLILCMTMGIYSSDIIYSDAAIHCHGISFSIIPHNYLFVYISQFSFCLLLLLFEIFVLLFSNNWQ